MDLIRRGSLDDGVVLLDRLVDARFVELAAVRDAAAALPRCRGSTQARTVAEWADGLAESPFAYPELELAIEYDGLRHAEPGQFAKDRRRLNLMSAAGWRVLFVTAADMHQPDLLVRRVVEARSR